MDAASARIKDGGPMSASSGSSSSGVEHIEEGQLRELAEAFIEAANIADLGLLITIALEEAPRVLFASEALARMLGTTTHDLESTPSIIDTFAASEHRAALYELRQRRLRQEPVQHFLEIDVCRTDGVLVPVEMALSFVDFQGAPASVVFVRDISERKHALEALRSSEQRFRELVEAAPEAVVVVAGNKLLYVNRALVRILGYDGPEEVVATPLRDLLLPRDFADYLERAARGPASNQRLGPRAYHFIHRDGTVVTLEVSSIPIEFDGAAALLGFGRDVTDRARLQAKLVQADRMATVGTLAAGVAHEVNNPLAYVLLNLGSLAKELPALLPEGEARDRVMQMLTAAQDGTERVATIVRDLRAVSRWDGEGSRLVDLRRVLEATTNIAGSELRERARLVLELDETPPVLANEGRLGQVFLNLLLNAAQAIPKGRPDDNEVRVTLAFEGERDVVVAISDTGAGIPQEQLERVFEPFFTTRPFGSGTGLGLSICQGIVTASDGTLTVESEVGRGTTFRVKLPASLSPAAMNAGAGSGKRRLRVMVIDHNPVSAAALERTLEREHEVVLSTRATDALPRLIAEPWDLVLCDLVMPETTGLDLYRELSVRAPGRERRLVFMTGADAAPWMVEFLAKVENPRLHKPFDIEAVEGLVRALLDRM